MKHPAVSSIGIVGQGTEMRQSVYITISLLVIILVTGCADKERQSTPVQENFTATTAAQGRTENAPELSEKPSGEPSEESSEEPENPFTPHSGDLLSEEEKETGFFESGISEL